ncbi:hypothetical protein CLAIMM_02024 [Cladophialophora immunda]|nr:hypothetical protein CLAIMM_02024 [Cladophialophora immunda]
MSQGVSALRSESSELTCASATSYQSLEHASQWRNKALEGLSLGSEFRIVRFLRNENHGDLYLLGHSSNEKKYVAKAIDFRGWSPKVRAQRKKHVKRLKASSSFICVLEEHGLKWVIRDHEESGKADTGIAPALGPVELDRTTSGGTPPPSPDQASEEHSTDIETVSDSSANRTGDRGPQPETDPAPDGDWNLHPFSNSTVMKVGSESLLGGDSGVVSEGAQDPEPSESAVDALSAAFEDLFGSSETSSEQDTSEKTKRGSRKEAGGHVKFEGDLAATNSVSAVAHTRAQDAGEDKDFE